MNDPKALVPRLVAEVARERVSEEPVVLIQGPRSVGKSTLLGSLAQSLAGTLVDLDDPDVLLALTLRGCSPGCSASARQWSRPARPGPPGRNSSGES